MQIYVTNPNAESVTVQLESPRLTSQVSRTVSGFSSKHITVTASLQGTGTQIENKGIRLIALEADVSVLALNEQDPGCGGFQVVPLDALGTEYYVMSLWILNVGTDRYSEFSIVATEDDTNVIIEIMPGKGVSWNYGGVTYNSGNNIMYVQLDRLQTLHIQDLGWNDLTGTKVMASKRIAVFSGVKKGHVSSGNTDHIVTQLTPMHSWGTAFALSKFREQASYGYKIIAREADTSVNVLNQPIAEAGSFISEPIITSDNVFITSDKPIQVAQFTISQSSSANGAPSMLLVPPLQQYLSFYAFTVPDNGAWSSSLMITVEAGKEEDIRLDDGQVSGWSDIPNSSPAMRAVGVAIAGGYHEITHLGNEGFAAFISGHDDGSDCDFSFVAGQCVQDLDQIVSVAFLSVKLSMKSM